MIKRFQPPEAPHQNFLGEPARPSLGTPVHKPSFGVRPAQQDLSQLQATLREMSSCRREAATASAPRLRER